MRYFGNIVHIVPERFSKKILSSISITAEGEPWEENRPDEAGGHCPAVGHNSHKLGDEKC